MQSTHIDETTLSLYATGYSGLRDDLVEYVEQHLRECTLCTSRLEAEKNREVEEVSLPLAAQGDVFSVQREASEQHSDVKGDLVKIDDDVPTNNEDPRSLTQILDAIDEDDSARAELWSMIYKELLGIAQPMLARGSADDDMDASDLVHETFIRLCANSTCKWDNRRHFFGAAARAMQQILVDGARQKQRKKRGGAIHHRPLDQKASLARSDPDDTIAIHEALTKLEKIDLRKAHIVKLRYFAGLTSEEIADHFGISPRTVDSEWRFAKAWLYKELGGQSMPASAEKQRVPTRLDPRIERLFEHARSMAPTARQEFLIEACGENKELFQSITSLLEHAGD